MAAPAFDPGAERLVRAALGEFSYGGDPVPDLFGALLLLLPDGKDKEAVEILAMRYDMAKMGIDPDEAMKSLRGEA